ncbi:MAG: hypothetical protein KF823_02500 [Xanthomonadales bacterium]|nr:hypothetical protein [Xanthomonadales bacterium]
MTAWPDGPRRGSGRAGPRGRALFLVAVGALVVLGAGFALWQRSDVTDARSCRSIASGQASADGRFLATPEGVLDTGTGLTWTACDSGVGREPIAGDADLDEAQAHCAALGRGWVLPTPAQLKALHEAQVPGGTKVHGTGESEPVLVRLSPQARWYWTGARSGEDRLAVNLWDGSLGGFPGHARFNMRALCVQGGAAG